jgi:pimeloyl-ACP methyl ester carboxylesterase
MRFRSADQELILRADTLAALLPDASSRICILLHGVMANESLWGFKGEPHKTYGSLLEDDLDVTPICLRYNTGRHILTNGRELAGLLGELIACWPVEVEEISFIGHSMGGLICRSACHYGALADLGWVSRVRRLFLLGVPCIGAPLEQLAHLTSFPLFSTLNPWTRLIGKLINLRSAGIKDLRHGYLIDEDWQGKDPDARFQRVPPPVPLLERAEHFVVIGSHPFSAPGQRALVREPGPFPEKNVRVFPSLNHADLLHHPEIYQQILDWWQDRKSVPIREAGA